MCAPDSITFETILIKIRLFQILYLNQKSLDDLFRYDCVSEKFVNKYTYIRSSANVHQILNRLYLYIIQIRKYHV